MQAIYFADHFILNNSKVEVCTLQLIGIAAILVAVKINEDRLLTFQQAVMECANGFTIEMIEKTERIMLLQLEFQTNVPTPMDFIQFFLCISNPNFSFNDIIQEAKNYSYVALIGTSIQIFQIT
jgi:hypothetical protein